MEQKKESKYEEYIKRTHAGYVGNPKKKFLFMNLIVGFTSQIKSLMVAIFALIAILTFFFIINGGPLLLIDRWVHKDEPKKESNYELEDANKDGIVTPSEYQDYHQDYWERFR